MDWAVFAPYASFAITAATFGWWLSSRFRSTEIRQENMLDRHETRDQQRHEENLVRFTKIETKLDILNQNGKH